MTKRAIAVTATPESKPEKQKEEAIIIKPPRFGATTVTVTGIDPLVLNAFPARAKEQIRKTQAEGSTAKAKRGRNREAKDFEGNFEAAKHKTADGRCGIHAAAFRNAMISACRVAGFAMTMAKLSIFVEADAYSTEGVPLVLITRGEPKQHEGHVRNASGVIDLRARPMWAPGWQAKVRLTWDEDQFTTADVINLLSRAGRQVGVGEGRPDSKQSAGCGWGRFDVGEEQA